MTASDEGHEHVLPRELERIPPVKPNLASCDSVILRAQPANPRLLRITRDGTTAIVKFDLEAVHDDLCLANYRTQVLKFLEDTGCARFSLDVAGVPFLPSGLLGLLASVKNRGYEVEVVNPSDEMCEVLKSTMLNSIISIRRT